MQKRRAQVREAQRSYQKRKDGAIASDKKRADDLLEVLSKLSFDIESLLQAAGLAGVLQHEDAVSKSIQKLWASYDVAINTASVLPELQHHQSTNARRIAMLQHIEGVRTATESETPSTQPSNTVAVNESQQAFDPTLMSFSNFRFEETTVIQSFQRTPNINNILADRSIFEVVKKRQFDLREAEKAARENGP